MYIDGFLLPVETKNLKAYTAMSKKAGKIWREHGALQYVETTGDDLACDWGVQFTKPAKAKPGETVVFSFIAYKSRAHRDQVNKKVMSDPRLQKMMEKGQPMPFDVKRMAYGGFKSIVDM